MTLQRTVVPELLDSLPADDARAIGSRADLRRINRIMGAASLLARALDPLLRDAGATRLVELGAGDGSLLLQVAERHAKHWPQVTLGLLDLQPVVSEMTLRRYRALGWRCEVIRADVFDWLGQGDAFVHRSRQPASDQSIAPSKPIVVANLFLHHFDGQPLTDLMHGIAARAHALVCIEPRRSFGALLGSRMLGVIGCNAVTRHDAVVSVHAGFRGRELAACWPRGDGWRIEEGDAGMFSHRFVAVRNQVPVTATLATMA